jgi:excinuclease ABC subunit A
MKIEKNTEKIIIKGARTHNLKDINVEMPRNKMVVITGVSGSGKSSLAFDTIFAEGQRRYVESLSSYARQFLNQMPKPDVDEITGLSPAISIDQKSRSNNPRSTVATITEIYDYLRVMYARIGHPHCPVCGEEIKKLSHEEILNFILEKIKIHSSVSIFSPVVRGRKGEYYQLLYDLLGKGFSEVRLDGTMKKLREQITLSKYKSHNIDVLVDSFVVDGIKKEELRMRLAEAVERALIESDNLVTIRINDEESVMSAKFACKNDGFSFPEVEPRLFSFNSPYGACPACNGLGTKYFGGDEPCEVCRGARLRTEALHVFLTDKSRKVNILDLSSLSILDAHDFFQNLKLSEQEKEISLPVVREIKARLEFMLDVGLDYLQLSRKANTLSGGEAQRIRLASQLGSRLVGALYVLDEPTIGLHQRDNDRLIKTLLNLRDLGNTILVVEHDEDTIFASDYMVDIGPKAGVHGGEIVVSGFLEDLLTAKRNTSNSRTLSYLRGETKIEIPKKRRVGHGALRVSGGKVFNIKNMNVEVPLGVMTSITGVSGSGKSSFMYEILYKNLQARYEREFRTARIWNCTSFSGTEYLSRAILIDQSPIGRTPRSNIATYTGAFTHIRDLFAATEEARLRAWKANRFSFNVKGGRCEACEGNGEIAVEMHFLPTVYVTCDVCQGKRFDKETLTVKYKKKNIHEVLRMTVEAGLSFFKDIPAISDRLQTLSDVGLGYLELGQSATTLSGGEAQRVKLSAELGKRDTRKTLYLLDEPTTGLHFADIEKLLEVLQRLVDRGNTVLVIEHNLDVIKTADYVIDLGPEGGDKGGQIVAQGTPEEVARKTGSFTAQYLRKILQK